jgi:hypothetical protein
MICKMADILIILVDLQSCSSVTYVPWPGRCLSNYFMQVLIDDSHGVHPWKYKFHVGPVGNKV